MARCGKVLLSLAFMALLAGTADAQRAVAFQSEGKQLMVTPTIMTAILFGAIWLVLFLVGFCCLFNVQTPSSYEEKCLVLNKQY
ncbi:unnamed protein product [Polarella glacialis]|uniref:Uncharacterized protein n=1 Tax=Polarella glacialis TaxID=89957 RepID=A0A813J2P9_POLGL|nr:unnamed protein product [Polarella glacialis]CAE8663674.1 unnamed protein product [Polarella glacialis]CAE8719863.1 unnamed protein product [Polarella glacialis]